MFRILNMSRKRPAVDHEAAAHFLAKVEHDNSAKRRAARASRSAAKKDRCEPAYRFVVGGVSSRDRCPRLCSSHLVDGVVGGWWSPSSSSSSSSSFLVSDDVRFALFSSRLHSLCLLRLPTNQRLSVPEFKPLGKLKEGKREISKQIDTNRGLTAHRKKEMRNSRVRLRKK